MPGTHYRAFVGRAPQGVVVLLLGAWVADLVGGHDGWEGDEARKHNAERVELHFERVVVVVFDLCED